MPKKEAVAAAAPAKLPDNLVVGSFINSRAQSLHTIHLPSKLSPPHSMAFIVHGIAEHSGRAGYVRLYNSLAEAGVDVYSFDQHGHGRSDGEPRGYAEKFDHFVDDLAEYIEICKKKYTDKGETAPPIILLGQSMGALISVLTTLRLGSDKVAGIILTAPALGVDMNLELRIQKFFAPVINTLAPKARIVDAVDPQEMSRNKDAVQAYIDDPLCSIGKLVARTAIGMSNGFEVVKSRRGEVTCPVLVLHGTCDKCTSSKASEDFFKHVGTSVDKKQYLKLQGMYHELLEEPETDHLLKSIASFAGSAGKTFAKVEGEHNEGVINVVFK